MRQAVVVLALTAAATTGIALASAPTVAGPSPAMTITSATWVPAAGAPSALVDGGSVAIENALVGGKVVVMAHSEEPLTTEDLVVVFSLQYYPGIFASEDSNRHFVLDPAYKSVSASGSGTEISVEIPLLTSPQLLAESERTQYLSVWLGRQGVVQIRAEAGVEGAAAEARYGFDTSLPASAVIPDPHAVPVGAVSGINEAGPVRLWVFRRDRSPTPETITLEFTGPAGFLDALGSLPSSAVIPADARVVQVDLTLDPHRTARWPGEAGTVLVRST